VDDEGKLDSCAKSRGRKAAINTLLSRMEESFDPALSDTVFIGHGDCEAEAQAMAETIKTRFGVKQVFINYVGAVIGAHTGPGVLVVAFFGKNR
jgi:fatty acid-binding protein DegV